METKLNVKKDNIKRVIPVLSGKGGVGKTIVAVNLALALSDLGNKVGLLDVDIHGPNVPLMLNIEENNLVQKNNKLIPIDYKTKDNKIKIMSSWFLQENKNEAVIWRGPLKHKLIQEFFDKVKWDDLDYLIVDFPPGSGDESISFSQVIETKLDTEMKSVIVTQPQKLSLKDAEKSVDFCRKSNIEIAGIIENMSGIFGENNAKKLAEKYNLNYFGTIPMSEDYIKESENNKIEVKEEFIEIAKELDNQF
ncbi:MAG: Mrp/NBP35 family ATP-binding protein [Candidatus Woesearchaeota archaeon]